MDAGVLLETKLHPPRIREEWVKRTELVQYLAASTAKLVLVDAPAGFGKSTLVTQWRAFPGQSRKFAWVSVDAGDNDAARLWWYIGCALQRACPELHVGDLLRQLRRQGPDPRGSLLPALVNELAELASPVTLVLDDYHMISNRDCHDQLEFFLLHLPPMTQIVLITRVDPPLPLGRLRAVGDLLEVRVPELRFVAAEAAALVRAVSAVQLGETDLADLVQRTEGWPAGIYLAALSLRGHPSPSSFIRQFSGDNRFVGDFLAQEVLSRQPREIRDFLCRAAILDRFTPSLCDAVVGSANAMEIIDILERENLFLVALDDDRQWFRYHQLFGQMLLSRLVQTEPDLVPVLHRRASEWHQRWGSVEEAIVHALAGGDIAGAVDVVARNWLSCVDTGRLRALRAWLDSIGDDRIRASPVAAHCAAWCAALFGEQDSVRRWLAVVEAAEPAGPLPDGMPSLEFSAALLRGVFGFDGIRAMRESAATAAELDTDPASPWYALARTALGAALYLSGEFDAAFAQLSDALQGDASIIVVRLLACSVAALVAVERGRVGRAQELVTAACDIAGEDDPGDAPRSAIAYTAAGAVAATQGHLKEARDYFDHALRAGRRCSGISPWVALDTMLRLAPVLYDLGDQAGAVGLVGEARAVLASRPDGAKAQLIRVEQLAKRFASRQRPQLLAEPLTDREEEVLRLLQGTLSLREIGQELFLSPNTIKTHARAIYRKLGVSTRQEAVERGREMSIL
jgi:LuxR family transcriptional regulator, maltose regulon positive regulatory protein